MASSDEDDLEVLRNAALASLRQKQASQEPQGIQVVSRLAIPAANQFIPRVHVPEPVDNPDGNLEYTEYGEVPYHFQQAVRQAQGQTRGQARGQGRGRGFYRGRGRGNWFPPKPEQHSALIVIQPAGMEQKEVKKEETPKDSRPFLLRPQDKWASTECDSQSASPSKPKVISKFSRYDNCTDSEDDDDIVEVDRAAIDAPQEDVGSDGEAHNIEVEIHNNSYEADVHEHDTEVDVYDKKTDLNNSIELDERETVATDLESTLDMSYNITVDEVHSDLNSSVQDLGKNDIDVQMKTAINKELNASDIVTDFADHSGSANVPVKEENSLSVNFNLAEGSDSTPLRDEPTPVQDELRQDDSFSNSYSAFSRFNRRNRGDSESGGESEEETDTEIEAVTNSRSSSVSRENSIVESESDASAVADNPNSDLSDAEADAEHVIEKVSNPPISNLKTNLDPQESKSSIALIKSSSNSSSSSESNFDSSSSSSSSSYSDSELEGETSGKKKGEENTSFKTISKEGSNLIDFKEKRLNRPGECNKHKLSTTDNKRGEFRTKERRDDHEKSPERKSYRVRKSVKGRLSPEVVKADPEFDATNYRDVSLYNKNKEDRHQSNYAKSRSDSNRNLGKEKKSRDATKSEWEYMYKDRNGKNDDNKIKAMREKASEKRHFGDIGKLKNEVKRDPKDSLNDEVLSRQHISRSNSFNKKENKSLYTKESHKDKKNKYSKSDSILISSSKFSKSKDNSMDYVKHREGKRKIEGSERRKSIDAGKKSKQTISKGVREKRSIENKLRRLASQNAQSGTDSDNGKNISSLSDSSSDSETEMWRDKKHGAGRKSADIELERRRREFKKRELKREMLRAERLKHERGESDKDQNRKPKHVDSYSIKNKFEGHSGNGDYRKRSQFDSQENVKEKYYKKNMVFYEKDNRKKFEELSSDSDIEVRKSGVISVVKTGMKKVTEDNPILVDISISKSKESKESKKGKVRSNSQKKRHLIIQVEKSSDEELSNTKSKKKKVKKRKKYSSDEESQVLQVKQTVNTTSNKDVDSKMSKTSVYDRLGSVVNRNITPKLGVSGDSEVTIPSGRKRIKLNSGNYSLSNKHGDQGDEDSALNLRIQKIQEKNAKIMLRNQEIEQDKQKYG